MCVCVCVCDVCFVFRLCFVLFGLVCFVLLFFFFLWLVVVLITLVVPNMYQRAALVIHLPVIAGSTTLQLGSLPGTASIASVPLHPLGVLSSTTSVYSSSSGAAQVSYALSTPVPSTFRLQSGHLPPATSSTQALSFSMAVPAHLVNHITSGQFVET